jgi:hypothetical protein
MVLVGTMADKLSDSFLQSSRRHHEEIACRLGVQSYAKCSAFADKDVDAVFTETLRAMLLRTSDRVSLLRHRATEICIAMEDLGLPALVTLHIIDAALPNNVQMAAKWALATTVKHFRRARPTAAAASRAHPGCPFQQRLLRFYTDNCGSVLLKFEAKL